VDRGARHQGSRFQRRTRMAIGSPRSRGGGLRPGSVGPSSSLQLGVPEGGYSQNLLWIFDSP
jgi:hypothetical protein